MTIRTRAVGGRLPRLVAASVAAMVLAAGCSGAATGDPLADLAPSTSPTSSPTVSPTSTRAPEPREFTVVASGDVLVHDGVFAQAAADAGDDETYAFAPMFDDITALVSGADLAICHMEVPIGEPGAEPSGYPQFSAPAEVADGLAETGYDTCSTASNHSLDRGADGVGDTLVALDAAGIEHTGTARSAAEAAAPLVLDVAGVKVAQLSYSYGFNGFQRPDDEPWRANLIDEQDILAAAEHAREAGAEVVIASLHWGTEYQHEPSDFQTDLADALLESDDIDLIIGHHAHVVQPIDRIGDSYVVYGLGNMIAAKSHNFAGGATREGIIPQFTFTEEPDGDFEVTGIEVTPVYISAEPDLHLVDVPAALAAEDSPERVRLQQAYDRTSDIVLDRDPPGVQIR